MTLLALAVAWWATRLTSIAVLLWLVWLCLPVEEWIERGWGSES